jgi:exonuclease VII small subunit
MPAPEATHEALKRTRQRGSETPNHLAAVTLLKKLDEEFDQIRLHLDEAWSHIDHKDFRRCSKRMDQAQQKLHKAIKKLSKIQNSEKAVN